MSGNYDRLYDQSREHFLTFDQGAMIDWFRLDHDDKSLYFHILGREARLERETGIITCGGETAGLDEACTAYDVLSRAAGKPALAGRWVSITDLGGNTASYHAEKLTSELSALEGRVEELREHCRSWGGQEQRQGDVSFILPLFRSFLFGMPPMFPGAAAMAFEFAAYALAAGLLYAVLRRRGLLGVYVSLIAAMIAGRLVWGAARWILAGLSGSAFTFKAFLAGAVLDAVPGIIMLLILIPLVLLALDRAKLAPFKEGKS